MLRNLSVQSALHVNLTILNEVLSLNAQEFDSHVDEVERAVILNEVLSLNAQEFVLDADGRIVRCSSMKS